MGKDYEQSSQKRILYMKNFPSKGQGKMYKKKSDPHECWKCSSLESNLA